MAARIMEMTVPVLAGVASATVATAYQVAQQRKVPLVVILLIMSLGGMLLFAGRTDLHEWSLGVVAAGLVAGVGQYLAIKLVGLGMRLGPFSAIWCMLSLAFAPVIVYAAVAERVLPTWPQAGALLCAVACCVVASSGLPVGPAKEPAPTRYVAYGLVLAAILLLNAFLSIGIQHYAGATAATNRFLFVIYLALALCCAAELCAVSGGWRTLRPGLLPGLLAAAGSVGAVLALAYAAPRVGAIAFVVAGLVGLLLPMLAAVLVFRERPTSRWLATLTLGLLAIVLANL